jgi:NTP pyrophosphatase (non-canonical NTP hydrolase)
MCSPVVGSGRDKREYSDVKSSVKTYKMNREEIIQILNEYAVDLFAHGLRYGYETNTPLLEKIADEIVSSLPPAEGAEENRNRIDGLIKKHISIDTANFEFCAKNNTINGSLLQGIRDVVNEFATLHAQRIAEKMVEEDDLQKLMNDISEWSDKTFGNGQQNPAIIYHLKKEVDELIAAIEKTNTLGSDPSVGVGEFGRQRTVTRVEYADCLMLLLDSAHHFGISAKELLSVTRGKLEINKVRKWGSPDENGVVEHIE